jgi:uncharacterized protein involved in exopolysaccharide biosynthesis
MDKRAAVFANDVSEKTEGADEIGQETSMLEIVGPLLRHLRLLVLAPLAAGALAIALTYLLTPVFTAKTTFLPPQQQQSATVAALASLGQLSGLAGAAAGLRSPADQYISLMQSVTVLDRVIDQFELMRVYDAKLRIDARMELTERTRISAGKKDGMISIEVDDEDPKRAAQLANFYVEALRTLVGGLAITEAQQRRTFFETQLSSTRTALSRAQGALESSGFNSGSLRAEPRTSAESYARMRAESAAAEVQLQALRQSRADTAAEVIQQRALLAALRSQLDRTERAEDRPESSDYIGKYREFKYQEMLLDLFSKQYEMARLDESKEGALVQVIDLALVPERKSRPRRGVTGALTSVVVFATLCIWIIGRAHLRRMQADPIQRRRLDRLRADLVRR